MKNELFSTLVRMVGDHPRTFELFAFTLVFLLVAVAIESIGLTTVTTNCILGVGGTVTIFAIAVGAGVENGGF